MENNRWLVKKIPDLQRVKSKSLIARTTTKKAIMTTLLIISAATVTSPQLLLNALSVQAQTSQGFAGTTFPPPIFSTIRGQPAYVINIPFSSEGKSVFQPKEISIPIGMTVIWFNNDEGQHTVTTLTNNTYSPPEYIESRKGSESRR